MEQTILKEWQKKAVTVIAKEPALGNYYLSGGTALAAYYLKHRISDDLDFFTPENPDTVSLHIFSQKLSEVLEAESVRYDRLYDRHQFFYQKGGEEQKVEFTHYPFRPLEESRKHEGIRIDSERDIAANKLLALLDRFDPKDFVDLYFLLQSRTLGDIRADAQQKFGMKIENLFLGGELAKVKRVEALPKMVRPLTVAELKHFFEERAKDIGSDILS